MKKLLAALVLITAFISGCSTGGFIKSKIEKGIAGALPGYIGPATEYKVKAGGSSTDMLKGLIEHLRIEGKDVQLDPALTVSRLVVDMDEVRYHTDSRSLKSVRSTSFEATITDAAVNQYIELARKDASGLTVKLEPGKVIVNFVPSVVGVDVLVSITGKPVVTGGGKINFEADSGSVAHLPVPAYVVNKVIDRMNPIIDMSVMKYPVVLKGITLKKNSAVIKGNLDFKPTSD